MHPEVIKSEQEKIFEKLKYFPEFYLAGGTALALQIGHRISIGRRITFKDYIDLYFILKGKFVSLQNLIAICKKKYGNEFNERLFLEQLICVEEAEEVPIGFLKKPITKKGMAEFFKEEIKKLKI